MSDLRNHPADWYAKQFMPTDPMSSETAHKADCIVLSVELLLGHMALELQESLLMIESLKAQLEEQTKSSNIIIDSLARVIHSKNH